MMQGSFAYDSFVRVSRRKKRKGKHWRDDAATPSDLLIRAKEELASDGGWSLGCRELLHEVLGDVKPLKVLCLGLGSPSSSRDARAQLALVSELCAASDLDAASVSVYDPVFTDADKELFRALGMRCLDQSQGAEHALDCRTVLYMPHCHLKLYEQVIRANWTLRGLCNLVFVANRFSDYVDGNAAASLEREAPCLQRLAPLLHSRALPTSAAFPSAFIGLAVQCIGPASLSLQDTAFWNTRERV